jgi:hypothetical protein
VLRYRTKEKGSLFDARIAMTSVGTFSRLVMIDGFGASTNDLIERNGWLDDTRD